MQPGSCVTSRRSRELGLGCSVWHAHDHGPPCKRALSICPLPYQKHWQNQEILDRDSCEKIPVMMNPHSLPVDQRIQCKLLIQMHKALNGHAPEYMSDIVQSYVPTRALRSAGAHLLLEAKTTTRWGGRPFSKAAPVLWNTPCPQP